jgi:uncharacterized membrane protein YhaH (DUF805 family)
MKCWWSLLEEMSAWKQVRNAYLNWNGRADRAEFAIGLVGLALFQMASVLASAFVLRPTVVYILLAIPIMVGGASLIARRAHDIGWSARVPLGIVLIGWALLLVDAASRHGSSSPGLLFLIALVANVASGVTGVILVFGPGDPSQNRFGPARSTD